MKRKVLSFALLSALVLGLASCGDSKDEATSKTVAPTIAASTNAVPTNNNDTTPSSTATPVKLASYQATLKDEDGSAIRNTNVCLVDDSNKVIATAKTNYYGKAKFDNVAAGTYKFKTADDSQYRLTKNTALTTEAGGDFEFTCLEKLPTGDFSKIDFREGSQVYNFTITTVDGYDVSIEEYLNEYGCLILNFFYTTCYYCNLEFPFISSLYNEYSDRVPLLAMDDYGYDTEAKVKAYKASNNYSFDMAYDTKGYTKSFVESGYPTTAVIDKYGYVTTWKTGALSESKWTSIFKTCAGE